MSEPWVLAIDFGTSYTVAAARRPGRAPEVIEIDGERRVPSAVLLDPGGQVVVGRAAEAMAASYPDRVLRTPKYRLGIPTAVVLGGKPYSIVDLVAAILAFVYREAVQNIGSVPMEVRLTYPASWSAPRREELLAAATRAGLPNPVLVAEPVAAAVSYADDGAVAPGSHVLVYDLGGGTFDTAALRADDAGFVVVGRPAGDPNLGGELFDELVANHMGQRLDPAVWEQLQVSDETLWQLAAASLRNEARRAKEILSSHPEADVLLGLPTGIVNQRMYKTQLDDLIRPYIQESIDVMTRCAIDAGLRNEDLQAVYLVGGASRSPIVRDMVGEVFPQVQLSRRGDPKAVVALGATHPGIDTTRMERRATDPGRTTVDGPGVVPPPPAAVAPAAVAPAAVPPTAAVPQPPPTLAASALAPPPPAPTAPVVSVPTATVGAAPTAAFAPVGSPAPVTSPPAPPPGVPPNQPAGSDRTASRIGLVAVGALAIVGLGIGLFVWQGRGDGGDALPPSSTAATSTTAAGPTTVAPTTVPPTTTPAPTTTLPAPQLAVNLADGQEIVLDDVDPNTGFAVTGKSDVGASVTVNGAAAAVSADGAWQAFVKLVEGDNPITVVARRGNSAPTERKFTLRAAPRPTTTTTTTTTTTRPTVTANNDSLRVTFQGPGVPVGAGNVFANDGGPLFLQGATQPGRGSASVAPNGAVVYTPDANGTYSTSFTYTICANGNAGFCRTATVTITVLCNRDFPGGIAC